MFSKEDVSYIIDTEEGFGKLVRTAHHESNEIIKDYDNGHKIATIAWIRDTFLKETEKSHTNMQEKANFRIFIKTRTHFWSWIKA